LAVAGGVIATSASALAQGKIDPAAVQYQPIPKDHNKCSTCVNFEAPDQCKIVSGKVQPDGWCVAFAPMDGTKG
jgi:recombinational DNA repair protein RecR